MDEKILTKEEYAEKLNGVIKPTIDFAMSTKQFNDDGCYCEEFVKVGNQEVTLAVVSNDWRIVHKDTWNDVRKYRKLYYDLQKENEELEEKSRKKFLGIF